MSARIFVVLLLLLSWAPIAGPIQGLVYLGPVALVAFAVVSDITRFGRVDALFLFLLFTFGVANSVFYDTGITNTAFGLLTYSSLVILAVRLPFSTRESVRAIIRTLLLVTAWLSIIQAGIGILQLSVAQGGIRFTAMTAGDYVVGTLGTNSHLYAAKMLFQGLILAIAWWTVRTAHAKWISSRILFVGGACAIIGALLASALLLTAFFLATVVLWGGWRIGSRVVQQLYHGRITRQQRRINRLVLSAMMGTGVFLAVFVSTQPENARIVMEASQAVLSGDFRIQKFVVLEESIDEVLFANPTNAFFGAGLGRYSSRAAMILSGGYLEEHPPWLPISRSAATTRRIYSLWNERIWAQYEGSVTAMPTSSFQSVIVEFGIIGTVIALVYAFSIVKRIAWLDNSLLGADLAVIGKSVPAAVLVLGAVSLTDLWLEYASLMASLAPLVAIGLSVPSGRFGKIVRDPAVGM